MGDLARYLDETHDGERSVLDLCCGTGLSAAALAEAGWRVVGVDLSPGMLAIAAQRGEPFVAAGRVELVQADARTFALDHEVGAAVCLDGALNHLRSVAELERCFTAVAAALRPGGQFLFDLYEASHFRHWNTVSVIDEPAAVLVKHGRWDDATGTGVLRVAGALRDGPTCHGIDQTLRSRLFEQDEVAAALRAAGFAVASCDALARGHDDCRSGACAAARTPCRVFYRGLKA